MHKIWLQNFIVPNLFSDTTSVPTYSALVVHDLDLSRVAQFDHGAHGDVELSARFQVQPHIVALRWKQFQPREATARLKD